MKKMPPQFEYQVTDLEKSPTYFKKTVQLIEESFAYESHNNFDIDFNSLFTPSQLKNNWIVIKDDQVIAHFGIRIRTLVGPNINVGLIGGLCIDKKFRKQGLFSKLFKQFCDKYLSNVAFFILWSSLSELYQNFGFFPCFGLRELEVSGICPSISTRTNKLSESDWEDIKTLFKHHISENYLNLHRTQEDWKSISNMTSMEVILQRHPETGRILSYAFKGKGQDLPGIIHEFAGLDLLSKKVPAGTYWVPDHPRYQNQGKQRYLGLVKPGSHKYFKQLIDYYTDGKINFLSSNHDFITFQYKEETQKLPPEEFLPLIFSPNAAQELTGPNYPTLFIGGVDSI